VGLGVTLGLPPCIAVSVLIRAYAPALRSFDPAIYVGVPLVLATLALAGSLVPAWGAARVDPVIALRED
jgi:ABC-type antimicrobial peptide transport system permease subunit